MQTILIVNAFPILRAGLRMILHDAGITIPIIEAGSAAQAQDRSMQDLSLAIIDPEMPDLDPVRFIQQLHKHDNTVPVLFFGYTESTLAVSLAVKLGADGYLHNSSEEMTIAAAIHTVLNGMRCFPKDPPPEHILSRMQTLSQKELSVLLLLRHGLRNKEIGEKLYLSEKTISAHKHSILSKLGISTIAQLIDKDVLATASHRQAATPVTSEPLEPSILS